MANVTIDDTFKVGWIKIDMNDYYPYRTPHAQFIFRKTNLGSVDKEFADGATCVELHISHEPDLHLNVSVNPDAVKSFTVDTVNGLVPSSIDDLRDKILALL
jgi:hypothetical protein